MVRTPPSHRIACLVLLLAACSLESCRHQEEDVLPLGPILECTQDGTPCLRFGLPGTCLRDRCILPSGWCSYDIDCDDGNPCTQTTCVQGACVAAPLAGAYSTEDGQGVCVDSTCTPPPPGSCSTDKDCPSLETTCQIYSCQGGVCALTIQPEDAACRASSGRTGSCRSGLCSLSLEAGARNDDVCTTKVNWYYGYYYRDCRKGLQYRLEPADLQSETGKIRDRIFEDLRYDMAVVLVPVADGGYNLVMHNKHDRTTVQGLVDPSFVAFTTATFTSATNWRSRQLHVWLQPYDEGWGISTAGSRFAVQKGRQSSALGWLGVVDVPAFRNWLQKAFTALPPAMPVPEVVQQVVPPLPAGASPGTQTAGP